MADLLVPLLARPSNQSSGATERLLALVGGIAARWWPTLATMTEELCAPARIATPAKNSPTQNLMMTTNPSGGNLTKPL